MDFSSLGRVVRGRRVQQLTFALAPLGAVGSLCPLRRQPHEHEHEHEHQHEHHHHLFADVLVLVAGGDVFIVFLLLLLLRAAADDRLVCPHAATAQDRTGLLRLGGWPQVLFTTHAHTLEYFLNSLCNAFWIRCTRSFNAG